MKHFRRKLLLCTRTHQFAAAILSRKRGTERPLFLGVIIITLNQERSRCHVSPWFCPSRGLGVGSSPRVLERQNSDQVTPPPNAVCACYVFLGCKTKFGWGMSIVSQIRTSMSHVYAFLDISFLCVKGRCTCAKLTVRLTSRTGGARPPHVVSKKEPVDSWTDQVSG